MSPTCSVDLKFRGPLGAVNEAKWTTPLLGEFFHFGLPSIDWLLGLFLLIGAALGGFYSAFPAQTVIALVSALPVSLIPAAVFPALALLLLWRPKCNHDPFSVCMAYGGISILCGFAGALAGAIVAIADPQRLNDPLFSRCIVGAILGALLSPVAVIIDEGWPPKLRSWNDYWGVAMEALMCILFVAFIMSPIFGYAGWRIAQALVWSDRTITMLILLPHWFTGTTSLSQGILSGTGIACLLWIVLGLALRICYRVPAHLETNFRCDITDSVREFVCTLQQQFDEVFFITEAGEWKEKCTSPVDFVPNEAFLVFVRKGNNYWLALAMPSIDQQEC